MTTPITPGPKPTQRTPLPGKRSWLRSHAGSVTLVTAGVVLGALVGGAAASRPDTAAEPQPVETVTVTETVEVAAPDDGCRDVAIELFDMLTIMNSDVVIPLASGGSEGITAILDNNIPAAEVAIAKINGATAVIQELTARTDVVGPAYQACTQ